MAVYTELTVIEVNEFLISKGINGCINYSLIINGTTNSNYLINTQNERYVLTIFEEVKRVGFLVDMHEVLAKNKFPCAQMIKPIEGQLSLKGKPALLFTWVEGDSVNNPSSEHCKNIGHYLAVLHGIDDHVSCALPATKDLVWSIKEAETLLELEISDEDADIILQELTYLRHHSRLSLPSGLIHADCFRDNVLFDGKDESLRLSGIIDFEYATHGAFMFDLAIVINDWCSKEDGSLDRLKMRDIIAAYSEVRPLEPIENQAIPFMLRAAAFRFWISRLSDNQKRDKKQKKDGLQKGSKCLCCQEQKKGKLQGSGECLFCREQKKDKLQGGSECLFCREQKKRPRRI